MPDYFDAFMRGWDFVDRINEAKDVRARREVLRERDDALYQQREDARELDELTNRFNAYARKPDGSYKKWEEFDADGRVALRDLGNHRLLAGARNAFGRQVDVVDVYGRGNEVVFEVEQKDPATGKVISRGPVTQNRYGPQEDPGQQDRVNVMGIDQIGKNLQNATDAARKQYERMVVELRAQSPRLNDAYQKSAADNEYANRNEKLLRGQFGAIPDGAPGAQSGAPSAKSGGKSPDPEHAAIVREVEQEFGLPPNLLASVWGQETNFGTDTSQKHPAIKSGPHAGEYARGPFGIMSFHGPLPDDFRSHARWAAQHLKERGVRGYYGTGQAPAGYPTTDQYEQQVMARAASMGGQAPVAATDPSIAAATPSAVQQTAAPPGTPGPTPTSPVAAPPPPQAELPPINPESPELLQGIIGYARSKAGDAPASPAQEALAAQLPPPIRAAIDQAPLVALRDPKWFAQNIAQVMHQNPNAMPAPRPSLANAAGPPAPLNNQYTAVTPPVAPPPVAAPVAPPVAPPVASPSAAEPASVSAAEAKGLADTISGMKPGKKATPEQFEAMLQVLRMNPKAFTDEQVERFMATGRMSKRDLKYVSDSFGGFYQIDEDTGETKHIENEAAKAFKEANAASVRASRKSAETAARDNELAAVQKLQSIRKTEMEGWDKVAERLWDGMKSSDKVPADVTQKILTTAVLYGMDPFDPRDTSALITGKKLTEAFEAGDARHRWAIPQWMGGDMNWSGQDRKFASYSVGIAAAASGARDPSDIAARVINPAMVVAKQLYPDRAPNPKEFATIVDVIGGGQHNGLSAREATQAAQVVMALGIPPERYMKMFKEIKDSNKANPDNPLQPSYVLNALAKLVQAAQQRAQ